jgi:hypothetical protein
MPQLLTKHTGLTNFTTSVMLAVLIVRLLAGPLHAQQIRLPDEEAILVMHTSELAAAAKNCNLEWQPYLDAFMAWQDRRVMWNEQQINSIKGLFLFAQGNYIKQLPEDYCSAEQLIEIKALTAERIGVLMKR